MPGGYANNQPRESRTMASSGTQDIEHVQKLIESIGFCMLSTWNGTELRSRPMAALVQRRHGMIYFLTEVRAHKDDDISRFPKVCVAFADPRGPKYVSVAGTAGAAIHESGRCRASEPASTARRQ